MAGAAVRSKRLVTDVLTAHYALTLPQRLPFPHANRCTSLITHFEMGLVARECKPAAFRPGDWLGSALTAAARASYKSIAG